MRQIELENQEIGIELVIKPDHYPAARIIVDKENPRGVKTLKQRRKLDLEALKPTEVGEVEMCHYGKGFFNPNGLKYINTEPLGACIGLTLWHPELKIGFIAHFSVRDDALQGTRNIFEEIRVMELMPNEFEARLFGGGLGLRGISEAGLPVSEDNKPASQQLVREIWEELAREDVSILETDLYGWGRRNIVLYLETGEVFDCEERAIIIPPINFREEDESEEQENPLMNISLPQRPRDNK